MRRSLIDIFWMGLSEHQSEQASERMADDGEVLELVVRRCTDGVARRPDVRMGPVRWGRRARRRSRRSG